MTNILMVCLGNICRSPLAEGILRHKLPNNLFKVDSAGTANYHVGSPPDRRSIAVAKANGIDITHLKGRQFSPLDFKTFDHIYVMDTSNYNNVIGLAKNETEKSKVKLILNEVYPNKNYDVPDPYYGGNDGFKNVYNMLDKACTVIANKLNTNNG